MATAAVYETRRHGSPRYSVAQSIEQETHFYAKQKAMLDKLFDKSGQREELRNDFLGAFEAFLADQSGELERAIEGSQPVCGMRDHQRAYFEATRL